MNLRKQFCCLAIGLCGFAAIARRTTRDGFPGSQPVGIAAGQLQRDPAQ